MKLNKTQLSQVIGLILIIFGVLFILYSFSFHPVNYLILLVTGFILAAIGIYLTKSRNRFTSSLRINGQKTIGQITKITLYKTTLIRPSSELCEYRIHCHIVNPITQQPQELISDSILFEPILDLRKNNSIDTYIDKKNPESYYVDISKIKIKNPPSMATGRYESSDGINYNSIQN